MDININKKKQAVIYGAGNIGRGFIGQLFYESGYEIVFIDVNKNLINLLNERKEYPIKFAGEDNFQSEIIIKNIKALDASSDNINSLTEIARVISKADIMAVSVGVNILKLITQAVANGINKRFGDKNFKELNIIICENLINAAQIMRDGVSEYINPEYKNLYNERIGFVQASVERAVPIQTDETKDGDPLRIAADDYKYLYADKNAFKGEIPEIKNIIARSPFEYYIKRKLYVHNMGHALCAYLGDIANCEYIWQAIENPRIKKITEEAMRCSGTALEKIYGQSDGDYTDDLLKRFANKSLGDTVLRVGVDLKRKLSPNDRIVGVYEMCITHSLPVKYMCLAIAAAANFKGDKLSGQSLEEILKQAGSYDYISKNPGSFSQIINYDKAIKSGESIDYLFNRIFPDSDKAV